MTEPTRRCTSRRPENREPALPPLDHFYMPAMPSLGLGRALGRWLRSWRQRRARRELEGLGDHLQRDLGVKEERRR